MCILISRRVSILIKEDSWLRLQSRLSPFFLMMRFMEARSGEQHALTKSNLTSQWIAILLEVNKTPHKDNPSDVWPSEAHPGNKIRLLWLMVLQNFLTRKNKNVLNFIWTNLKVQSSGTVHARALTAHKCRGSQQDISKHLPRPTLRRSNTPKWAKICWLNTK
jgi:hypothetical protein